MLIKAEKIKDPQKLANVQHEMAVLYPECKLFLDKDEEVELLFHILFGINTALWEVEDRLREYEKNQNFGKQFIEDARSVYIYNDKRALIKKEINVLTKSELVEEKSYASY